jgi:hypothetical protein
LKATEAQLTSREDSIGHFEREIKAMNQLKEKLEETSRERDDLRLNYSTLLAQGQINEERIL